ncbi:Uncharacterised protein r2_g2930 [Pycnogonum litorale]
MDFKLQNVQMADTKTLESAVNVDKTTTSYDSVLNELLLRKHKLKSTRPVEDSKSHGKNDSNVFESLKEELLEKTTRSPSHRYTGLKVDRKGLSNAAPSPKITQKAPTPGDLIAAIRKEMKSRQMSTERSKYPSFSRQKHGPKSRLFEDVSKRPKSIAVVKDLPKLSSPLKTYSLLKSVKSKDNVLSYISRSKSADCIFNGIDNSTESVRSCLMLPPPMPELKVTRLLQINDDGMNRTIKKSVSAEDLYDIHDDYLGTNLTERKWLSTERINGACSSQLCKRQTTIDPNKEKSVESMNNRQFIPTFSNRSSDNNKSRLNSSAKVPSVNLTDFRSSVETTAKPETITKRVLKTPTLFESDTKSTIITSFDEGETESKNFEVLENGRGPFSATNNNDSTRDKMVQTSCDVSDATNEESADSDEYYEHFERIEEFNKEVDFGTDEESGHSSFGSQDMPFSNKFTKRRTVKKVTREIGEDGVEKVTEIVEVFEDPESTLKTVGDEMASGDTSITRTIQKPTDGDAYLETTFSPEAMFESNIENSQSQILEEDRGKIDVSETDDLNPSSEMVTTETEDGRLMEHQSFTKKTTTTTTVKTTTKKETSEEITIKKQVARHE